MVTTRRERPICSQASFEKTVKRLDDSGWFVSNCLRESLFPTNNPRGWVMCLGSGYSRLGTI